MNPNSRRTGWLFSLVMLTIMAGWEASAAQSASADSAQLAAPALAPQMIVKPVQSGVQGACRSETLAQQLSAYAAAGEMDKYQSLLQGSDCMVIPQDGMFRVLKVRDGLIEFVSFFSRSFTGYWTTTAAMKPVK
jgi:hypothetical protein